ALVREHAPNQVIGTRDDDAPDRIPTGEGAGNVCAEVVPLHDIQLAIDYNAAPKPIDNQAPDLRVAAAQVESICDRSRGGTVQFDDGTADEAGLAGAVDDDRIGDERQGRE